jgi:hypothetical protein
MNNHSKYIITIATAATIIAGGCTKDFRNYNKDPYGASNDDLLPDYGLVVGQL